MVFLCYLALMHSTSGMPFSNVLWYIFFHYRAKPWISAPICTLLWFCSAFVLWLCAWVLQPFLIGVRRSSVPVSGFIRNYRWTRHYFEVIIPFVLSCTDFVIKGRWEHNLFYWVLLKTALSNLSSHTGLSQRNKVPLAFMTAHNKLTDVIQLGS